jgi:hypothetical protein
MRTIKKYLVLSLLSLWGSFAIAQNNFDLEVKNFILPDSANFGENINASFYIKNNGSESFSGTMSINYMVTNSTPAIPSGLNANITDDLFQVNIAPNDSVRVTKTFGVNSTNRFGSGNNIVIVWPRYNNNTFNDANPNNDHKTKTIHVKVNNESSRDVVNNNNNNNGNLLFHTSAEKTKKEIVKTKTNIYPNPAVDRLFIELSSEIESADISIVNLLGTTVKTYKGLNNKFEVRLNDFETGYYFVKIESNAKTEYHKIFKK